MENWKKESDRMCNRFVDTAGEPSCIRKISPPPKGLNVTPSGRHSGLMSHRKGEGVEVRAWSRTNSEKASNTTFSISRCLQQTACRACHNLAQGWHQPAGHRGTTTSAKHWDPAGGARVLVDKRNPSSTSHVEYHPTEVRAHPQIGQI